MTGAYSVTTETVVDNRLHLGGITRQNDLGSLGFSANVVNVKRRTKFCDGLFTSRENIGELIPQNHMSGRHQFYACYMELWFTSALGALLYRYALSILWKTFARNGTYGPGDTSRAS